MRSGSGGILRGEPDSSILHRSLTLGNGTWRLESVAGLVLPRVELGGFPDSNFCLLSWSATSLHLADGFLL